MAGAQRGAPARSGKSTFERVIERVATSVGDTIGWMAEHGVLLIFDEVVNGFRVDRFRRGPRL